MLSEAADGEWIELEQSGWDQSVFDDPKFCPVSNFEGLMVHTSVYAEGRIGLLCVLELSQIKGCGCDAHERQMGGI